MLQAQQLYSIHLWIALLASVLGTITAFTLINPSTPSPPNGLASTIQSSQNSIFQKDLQMQVTFALEPLAIRPMLLSTAADKTMLLFAMKPVEITWWI
jgi:hypothetical protein